MAVLGTLLRNRRAGQSGLAWNTPGLAGPETLTLTSPDFEHEGAIPSVHAERRVGGENLSPALTWSQVPAEAAQLLLVVEDPDAPASVPFLHCAALLDPTVTGLAWGALDAAHPAIGVRVLRKRVRRGYHGPGPVKGHGPHRYVFQLYALARPVALPRAARARRVIAAAGGVLARGRLDGRYERS